MSKTVKAQATSTEENEVITMTKRTYKPLTTDELKEMGFALTEILQIVEMNSLVLEILDYTDDIYILKSRLRRYTDVAYEQNKRIFKKLDDLAMQLLNNTSEKV